MLGDIDFEIIFLIGIVAFQVLCRCKDQTFVKNGVDLDNYWPSRFNTIFKNWSLR